MLWSVCLGPLRAVPCTQAWPATQDTHALGRWLTLQKPHKSQNRPSGPRFGRRKAAFTYWLIRVKKDSKVVSNTEKILRNLHPITKVHLEPSPTPPLRLRGRSDLVSSIVLRTKDKVPHLQLCSPGLPFPAKHLQRMPSLQIYFGELLIPSQLPLKPRGRAPAWLCSPAVTAHPPSIL